MSELRPAPFGILAKRIFKELEREKKIFDLPVTSFFQGDGDLDTSVVFHGYRASTPLGPAAGPNGQLAQNIVLSWLGGSRIIELKTVQIQDRLNIPRPCIDAANVGYNVEWSQELRLEESLREYVSASMLLEMLRESALVTGDSPRLKEDTIMDMSVGYDLKGLQSAPIRRWLQAMKDATSVIDPLRSELPSELRRFRDHGFKSLISDTLTLSTFHGCPADEVERMAHFLLSEMDLHVTIKMNPTLLGREQVEYLLHDVLGYNEIRVTQEAFDKDLQFEDALEICRRLDVTARRLGKRLGVKFSNTLVVQNHKSVFKEDVMYLSGPPLHVLTMNLLQKFRERTGCEFPVSFSAGIDQHNFPTAVGLNLVPVTTCTDLLRPGGYGRLHKYMRQLESRMKSLEVRTLGDYVLVCEGHAETAVRFGMQNIFRAASEIASSMDPERFQCLSSFLDQSQKELLAGLRKPAKDVAAGCRQIADSFEAAYVPWIPRSAADRFRTAFGAAYPRMVNHAGLLNTAPAVERAKGDPRYSSARNQATPRKIGSHLRLFDCISCDKCVPVCPNHANFVYDLDPTELDLPVIEISAGTIRKVGTEHFSVEKSHQLANLADFCNDCGNCDVFCPEDGGPFLEKPRFFLSAEAWHSQKHLDGFCVRLGLDQDRVLGRIAGQEYTLDVDNRRDCWTFCGSGVRCVFSGEEVDPIEANSMDSRIAEPIKLDLRSYWIMRTLYRGVMTSAKVNYLNIHRIS
jgi:putative selenate reductase